MTKLTAIQQIYIDHYRAFEFDKRVIQIMIQLSRSAEVTRHLNKILTDLLQYNRAYKLRHICRIIGRSRAATRKFGLTRMTVRTYGKAGFLPGLTKAS